MIERISVVGSGTMGRGIAYVCAVAGYATTIHDVDEARLAGASDWFSATLDKGLDKGRVDASTAQKARESLSTDDDLERSVENADLVIEAVPEDELLKRELLAQIDMFTGPETIMASNTSSISITHLAKNVERRDRFIGLHFFNPVHVMKLLEIVRGERTADETIEEAVTFAERISKEPIIVRDAPGFATSRLGLAIGLEAIRMVEEEVASAEDIDRAMELGYRHPMGPLRLTDLVGLDVRLKIAEYLEEHLGPRFSPPQILRDMVERGDLGQKSGKGFYDWKE